MNIQAKVLGRTRLVLVTALIAMVSAIASSSASLAACLQSDLQGQWRAYGLLAERSGGISAQCRLFFDSAGAIITSSSTCSFVEPPSNVKITVRMVGTLGLTNGVLCTYGGNITVNGGGVSGRVAVISAGLSPDKIILAGTGYPTGASTTSLSFTALKK